MDNLGYELFSHITEPYTRCYEINPKFTNGIQVTMYAECSPNTTGRSNDYYALRLYFSADGYPTRDFITGVYFGKEEMDKRHLDGIIDVWVDVTISDESFSEDIEDYMRNEAILEDFRNDEFERSQGNVE